MPSPAPHHGLPLSIRGVRVHGDVIVVYGGQTTGNFLTPFFDVSTDGGGNWSRSPGPRALPKTLANNFDAADADHWAVGWSNYLYITDDAGKTWNESAFAGVYQITDVAILDANVAFVSGLGDKLSQSAVVLETTDGATIGQPSTSNRRSDLRATWHRFPAASSVAPRVPMTPAPPGDPPPGLVAAAIENVRTERHYEPTVDSVYRVGGPPAGTFASVFTFNVGSCGKSVVDNSWVVELHGPIGQGGGGSTRKRRSCSRTTPTAGTSSAATTDPNTEPAWPAARKMAVRSRRFAG